MNAKSTTTPLLTITLTLVFLSLTTQAQTIQGVFDYDMAKKMVKYVNKGRLDRKERTFKMEQALTEAAMLRAAELAFQWSEKEKMTDVMDNHLRPNGKEYHTLITQLYAPESPSGNCKEFFCYSSQSEWRWNKFFEGSSKEDHLKPFSGSKWKAIGAGAFHFRGQQFCVLLLSDYGNGIAEIPSGRWDVRVQIGIAGNKTAVLKRSPATSFAMPSSTVTTGTFRHDFATEVVHIVNKIRIEQHLPPLAMDSTLTEYAMLRAAENNRTFSILVHATSSDFGSSITSYSSYYSSLKGHFRPWGGDFETIFPVTPNSGGENVATGHKTPEEVVDAWMKSPGHRANILKKSFTLIGVGCFFSEDDRQWVQLFSSGQPKDEYQPDRQEEVTVEVSLVAEQESKVVKRERMNKKQDKNER